MDGNATCHRTLAVQDCLDSEGYSTSRGRPARSPDLNPTGGCFCKLLSKLSSDNQNTLIRALPEEWDKLPQQAAG
ncbi:hypothetical protein TNCV_2904261 [Trichonephila clavipes]|nr:hypothetical protein TNCV_2904261 [Trichonephila clavipes]